MGSPIPESPTTVDLSRLAVGRSVSAAHVRRWCDDLNFLRGRVVATVADVPAFADGDETGATHYRVAYHRTPGVIALRVETAITSNASNATANVTITSSEGTTWIMHNGLDGSRDLLAPSSGRVLNVYSGILDVSGHSDTMAVISLQIDPVASSRVFCHRFIVQEICLADTDAINNPTTEVGINAAWPIAPTGQLIEGANTESDGFARVLSELDNARYRTRRHIQFVTVEYATTSGYFATNTPKCTTVAPSWGSFSFVFGPLQLQTRPLHPSTANKYKVWVRYVCSVGGKLRIGVKPVGGSTTDTDITLSASSSWTSATLSSIDMPTTGTNGEVEITLQGQVDSSGSLYISTFALIENET